jgi:stage III sporulation protein SpoIIIAA
MTNTNAIVLPTALVPGTTKSPENLIIYSKPKTGKTTMLSKLRRLSYYRLGEGY